MSLTRQILFQRAHGVQSVHRLRPPVPAPANLPFVVPSSSSSFHILGAGSRQIKTHHSYIIVCGPESGHESHRGLSFVWTWG